MPRGGKTKTIVKTLALIPLALLSLAAVVASETPATAGPKPAPSVATSGALPKLPSNTAPAGPDCAASLQSLVSDLSGTEYGDTVRARTALIANGNALAESCGTSSGYCVLSTTATFAGDEIVGTSKVGEPTKTARVDVPFRILADHGKARMIWKYGGKSHAGAVDSCVGGIWTATSSSSAIAISLSAPETPPT